MKELQGKVCLVTGATRGIGRATALALAEAGANVLFSYQNSVDMAAELERLIADKGVKARGYRANVSIAEEVMGMVRQAENEFGPISILVNNAGITRDKSFVKM